VVIVISRSQDIKIHPINNKKEKLQCLLFVRTHPPKANKTYIKKNLRLILHTKT